MKRWLTKEGKEVSLRDMSYEHVRNARNMLLSNVSDAQTALACCDPLQVGGMTYSETFEWVEWAENWIEEFNNELSFRANKKQ